MQIIKQILCIGILLLLSNQVSAGLDEQGSESADTLPSQKIVDCVLRDSLQSNLLQKIDSTKALYTHRCTGGIYLIDRELNPEGDLRKSIPVVQGWWLNSILGFCQDHSLSFCVVARFITGVGPSGSRPFVARICLKRMAGLWHVNEPELLEDYGT